MRAALVIIGLALGAYGVVLLFENSLQVLVRIAVWAGVGAVLHDFVFAPVAAALGLAGRRLFRGRWWTPVSVAGLCSCVLVLLAIPVYTRPGAHADNTTVLDRDYPLGFWIAFAVVWACVPVYYLISRLLPVRQDEVVQRKRANDVESQPPPV
jgi:hypothetical protein